MGTSKEGAKTPDHFCRVRDSARFGNWLPPATFRDMSGPIDGHPLFVSLYCVHISLSEYQNPLRGTVRTSVIGLGRGYRLQTAHHEVAAWRPFSFKTSQLSEDRKGCDSTRLNVQFSDFISVPQIYFG